MHNDRQEEAAQRNSEDWETLEDASRVLMGAASFSCYVSKNLSLFAGRRGCRNRDIFVS